MQENQSKNEEQELDLNHLMKIRKEKLDELKKEGKDPFEITKFNRTNTAGEIKANYEKFEQKDVTVCRKNNSKKNYGESVILYNTRL